MKIQSPCRQVISISYFDKHAKQQHLTPLDASVSIQLKRNHRRIRLDGIAKQRQEMHKQPEKNSRKIRHTPKWANQQQP